MGACYSVKLDLKLKEEKAAIQNLKNLLDSDESTDYNLETAAANGISMDSMEDLIKIFLGGCEKNHITTEKTEGFDSYSNDFDASYGWEQVLIRMFQCLLPHLENDSRMFVCIENDSYTIRAINGKSIWEE